MQISLLSTTRRRISNISTDDDTSNGRFNVTFIAIRPNKRISAKEALEHPFFKELNNNKQGTSQQQGGATESKQ